MPVRWGLCGNTSANVSAAFSEDDDPSGALRSVTKDRPDQPNLQAVRRFSDARRAIRLAHVATFARLESLIDVA